jgi:hypothetical protein
VKAARYRPDTGWAGTVAIESNATPYLVQPKVAVDPAGNAIAVWAKTIGSDTNIWWNRYSVASGLWADAGRLETDGGSGAPHVAVDPSGNAIAAWEQSVPSPRRIMAKRFSIATGLWSGAEDIAQPLFSNARNPWICFDSAGNATAVWWQEDYSFFGYYGDYYSTNGYRPDGGWTNNIAVIGETDAGAAASYPRVACALNGSAVAVWDQWDGTNYNIAANVYR